MSFESLARLGIEIRPLTRPELVAGGRMRSPFSALWGTTVAELSRELRTLSAKRIVLEADFRQRDIRVDGLPRADARTASPGVVLAFESKHGPVQYPCGAFIDWRDNVRAISLSLEALRRVDRYGVSKRGEQYRGWLALPAGADDTFGIHTEEQAWAALADAAGVPRDTSPLMGGLSENEVVKRALFATHPDRGGNPEAFRKVQRAREVLRRA